MNKILKMALPALALLASATVAHASTYYVDNGSGLTGPADYTLDPVNYSVGAFSSSIGANGQVNDTVNFALSSASTGLEVEVNFDTGNLNSGSVSLYNGANLLASGAITPSGDTELFLATAAQGNYSLEIVGTGVPTTTYSGSVSISSVPLPAALPMFGAGLVGLGAAARRRKSNKAA